MSLKKRIFRSNMTILFLALISLAFVAAAVVAMFEDAFLREFESMDNAQLDAGVYQAAERLQAGDLTDREKLARDLRTYGYELLVLKDGKIIYGKTTDRETDLVEEFDMAKHSAPTEKPEIYYHQKITAAGMYVQSEGTYVMAAHFPQGKWWISTFRNSFASFFAAFLIAGAGAIVVLLVLSSIFTRWMTGKIMEPLDLLVAAAERIRSGNLAEKISYSGDGEFEEVCSTFNQMQQTMLEDQEQRIRNEKARTDMVTGISHDLRTPLTAIRGYIKGILDGVAGTEEKKRAYLETAYESAVEMNTLLQKLFDFSRMESGRMPFHMIRADLGEFAAAYAAQKEKAPDSKPVVIDFQKEGEVLPEIEMDTEQMIRVFDNLLENSRKYGNRTPVKIRIHVYESGSNIILDWSDNGPGVPEEKLGAVFERFYRCDEARSKKGSGVGLYVVKYIVEQHGGTITAENAEEGGLLLRMSFPEERSVGS